MRYSLSEYILYISLRTFAALFQLLPLRFGLFIGRALGGLGYWFDYKHSRVAYGNLRIALGKEYGPAQLKAILKKNYRNFGMNIVETLRLPKLNRDYINRYINIKGRGYLERALKDKKGAIFLGAHFGSWEMCFAIAGILGYPFYIVAEEQPRNPLLDKFLNQIRRKHGVNILKAGADFRQAISALQEGKFLGMVADHGIKEGEFANFFGRRAHTPSAPVRISLRFNLPILLTYLRRVKGPEHELVISPPLEINRANNSKQNIINNLEVINRAVENYIAKHPEQYLWFYKRFKYSNQRNILVLHDGKTGHIRQAQAVTSILENIAREKDLELNTKSVKVEFKNRPASLLQALGLGLAKRSSCRGCLLCLKLFLNPQTLKELQYYFADMVVSCGSSAAAVNFVISAENQAGSVVLMRPGMLSTKRFDLLIMPVHDNPPARPNVILTQGALNLIDDEYMKDCARRLIPHISQKSGKELGLSDKQTTLGFLLGGDTKKFRLSVPLLKPLIIQIKLFLERHDGQILITTSRRTSPEAERLIRQEFGSYQRCRLLVVANEQNIPEAVGGILGLSKILVVSPESISMVSEAASAGKYVVVFKPQAEIGKRHKRFLEHLTKGKYIHLAESARIGEVLEQIITAKPKIMKLDDKQLVREGLAKLL